MRRFVAFFILCLSFLLLSGQEIFGYYESPSSNFYNFQWQKLPRNDTSFLVIKQERKYSTKYVISYNDIKVSREKAKSTDSVVTYYGGSQSISFFSDGTYQLIQHNTDIYYPDVPVVSEGKYIRVKNYAYYLYSNPLVLQRIELQGREEKGSADSYQIEIIDTFRNHHSSYGIDCLTDSLFNGPNYYYDIRLYYDRTAIYNFRLENPTFDLQSMEFQKLSCADFYEEFISYGNRIEIPKRIPVPIHRIDIRIISYGDEVGGFEEYYVQDTSSNRFVIEIPAEAYAKINFLEFDGEIAEFIDDNTIGFLNRTWYKDRYVCGKKPHKRLRKIWKYRYQLSDPYSENRIKLKVPRERR